MCSSVCGCSLFWTGLTTCRFGEEKFLANEFAVADSNVSLLIEPFSEPINIEQSKELLFQYCNAKHEMLSLCMYVCVCMSVCLSICLSVSVHLRVRIRVCVCTCLRVSMYQFMQMNLIDEIWFNIADFVAQKWPSK